MLSHMLWHAVQTAMTFPDWVTALDEMLPKLASAIRFALAAAAIEGDKYLPAPFQKEKGKPGAKPAAPAKKVDTKVSTPLCVSVLSCPPFHVWGHILGSMLQLQADTATHCCLGMPCLLVLCLNRRSAVCLPKTCAKCAMNQKLLQQDEGYNKCGACRWWKKGRMRGQSKLPSRRPPQE